jgi:hypothetical protein
MKRKKYLEVMVMTAAWADSGCHKPMMRILDD